MRRLIRRTPATAAAAAARRSCTNSAATPPEQNATTNEGEVYPRDECGYSKKPVEMIQVFQAHKQRAPEKEQEDEATAKESNNRKDGKHEQEELAEGLRNVDPTTPYRVSWYEMQGVSPAKRFAYWSYRHLRYLPEDWREYYRRMLRQELVAGRFVNRPWDIFMMVVDGYRKAKWILKKYNIPFDEKKIQRPYNNFWEETTHEERVWAHRRSFQMKELQAIQREDDELLFGAMTMDRKDMSYNTMKNVEGAMQQHGTPVHSLDMDSPTEKDVRMSRHDEDMSSALMGTIEDDKLWNPVLKARLHKESLRREAEMFALEEDDDDDDGSGDMSSTAKKKRPAAAADKESPPAVSKANLRGDPAARAMPRMFSR